MTAEEKIRRAFAGQLPPGRVLRDGTNFFEAGYTSTRLAEVLVELADDGIELRLIDMFRYPTLTELIAMVTHQSLPEGAVRMRMPWDGPGIGGRVPGDEMGTPKVSEP